jgi:hypothetical protein
MLAVIDVVLSEAKNLLFALVSREGGWVLLITGLLVCGVFALTCHREAPTPLPTAVAQQVERHRVQSAVDSVAIRRLKRGAASRHVKRDTAIARATEAADSGDYRRAYVEEDSAVLALNQQVAVIDVALTKSESRAMRADSVIAAVLPIAESREPPCRIAWVVPCPTRRAVAVAAAVVTAAVIVEGSKARP